MLIRENLPSSAKVSKRNLLHSPMMTRSPGLNTRVPHFHFCEKERVWGTRRVWRSEWAQQCNLESQLLPALNFFLVQQTKIKSKSNPDRSYFEIYFLVLSDLCISTRQEVNKKSTHKPRGTVSQRITGPKDKCNPSRQGRRRVDIVTKVASYEL